MVDLFLDRVLVKNNWDQDQLNTEREITGILENRILMLFFASAECKKCQDFLPVLNDFYKRLKDPAHIEYPKLLALIYVSLDQSEEQQDRFLKELNKRILFVAFEDPYRKELQAIFKVTDVPTVIVLRPDGSVLSPNAVQDICRYGLDCFKDWQESAELIERSFMLNEEYDNLNLRSATDPVRRLKYKTEDDKRKKRWWKVWEKGKEGYEEEEEKDWDSKRKEGDDSPPSSVMVDLFMNRILVKNNREQDKLDTKREIVSFLQSRFLVLLLCVRAVPLSHFFKRLTDKFYVHRSAQLVLLYISLDCSEEQQKSFLKQLPRRCLFLAYEDPYKRELEAMFNVEELPTVVVLWPDCSILFPNAVEEILCLGPDCYRNWQEAAELIDRNFMINKDFGQKTVCSQSDPVRRLKYKVKDEKKKKKKKKKHRRWQGRDEEDHKNGGGLPF
ncbi:LOW QUALITY PROTEIN: nucleoredoxin-like protein 1 [Tautogolabrus adspersus]